MKVVALGAAGAMGQAAVELAATFPAVTELVLADVRPQAALSAAAGLRRAGLEVSVAGIDVLDAPALHALLADADAVMNTAGPFFRLGIPALRAAIATGTAYLDICDDPAPTRALLALHDDAVAAGVTAIIGIGASPGLSNLLAVLACRQLDRVHDLYCAWPVDAGDSSDRLDQPESGTGSPRGDVDRAELLGPDGSPSAAVVHWLEQLHGTVPVMRDGRLCDQRPLTPVALSYPGRRGGAGYLVGHPEPITLGPNMQISGNCGCLMIITPGTAAYLDRIRRDLDRQRLTVDEAARLLVRPSTRRRLSAALHALRMPGPGDLPPFFALATGTRDGRPATATARLRGLPMTMSTVTGVPLALALNEVLTNLSTCDPSRPDPSRPDLYRPNLYRPGVHPPEQVLDPTRLLTALRDVPAMQQNGAGPELEVVVTPGGVR